MNPVRTLALTGIVTLGAVLLAACGGSSGGYGSGAAAAGPTGQTTAAAAPTADVRLNAVMSSTLGTIVTDAKGFTLYRFDKDTAKPSASNCSAACAVKWPPVLTSSDQVSLSGVDSSVIGTVTRADGSRQITVGGWPVYRFANDAVSGDIKGEGVGGTWYAVTPLGKKAIPSASTGSGY